MAENVQPRPRKEAARITVMLDAVLGADRFDRAPVDMISLALEYSKNTAPNEAIELIEERSIPGCVGALICGDDKPRKWGILYDKGQSPGRRAFTVGHEFGHWVLHRVRVDQDDDLADGFYCDEEAITQRSGAGIEDEADMFAADLLMPFHDFRKQLPPRERPDFDRLGALAKRYGVSLEAAIIRWLEYTETRAILVVSNEGFARWSKPSKPAFRSGRFIRSRRTTYSLPALSTAVTRNFVEETKVGIEQEAGVWFSEPLIEMCFRSDRYDQEYTLLHFERERVWDFEKAKQQFL
jgi:hypothetical protein